ncbi:MAG: ribosomal protein S6 modification protein [Phycisphaeraceae bacterium]|nr:MAG: ribosomal protein S6 modification protein [Phycisphaeraceae bacterium]
MCGWRERVDLPDWGVTALRAKLDTGARTSAIHVAQIQDLPDGRIRFEVVLHEKPAHEGVWIEAMPVREATVKPSSGKRQRRPVVRTKMAIGGIERDIEISLVCRKGMLCRMLVGRRALEGAFLVDPQHRYLLTGKAPKTKAPR